MNEVRQRDYRYERKFLVEGLDQHQAISLIKHHPYMFYQPYPPRHINNFYLDTPEMDNYNDNVSGAADRRKVRLRWYGELFGNIHQPTLEIKIKRGVVGTKRLFPAGDLSLGSGFDASDLQNIGKDVELPEEVKLVLLTQQIVLLNRYYRYYFATRDNRYRLTVDTDLSYHRVSRFDNQFVHSQHAHNTTIVEMKYAKRNDLEANRIAGFFPFRVTKSSKYVTGIERVFF